MAKKKELTTFTINTCFIFYYLVVSKIKRNFAANIKILHYDCSANSP